MTLVLETGGGTPNANTYVDVAFVTAYLTARGRQLENTWAGLAATQGEGAVLEAARYMETRWGQKVRGRKLQLLIPGARSTGTVTFAGVPSDGDTVQVGQVTYTYRTTPAAPGEIELGATADEAAANLAAAIGGSTPANFEAFATVDGAAVTVNAVALGSSGDYIALVATGTNLTASGATLTGGVDDGPQPLTFPRRDLYDRDGRLVSGVPLAWKWAQAELAVRGIVPGTLFPDPTRDATGVPVQRLREKVGPIETETEYVEGASIRSGLPSFPAVNKLVAPFLTAAGVYR